MIECHNIKPKCEDDSKCCNTDGISKDLKSGYNKVSILSEQIIRRDCWGHECSSTVDKDIDDLLIKLEVLEEEKSRISSGYKPCLKCSDLSKLRESIRLTSLGCQGGYEICEIDDSGREEWKLKNPNCFAYEVWEKCLIDFCGKLNISVEEIKELPKELSIAIVSEDIDKELILSAAAAENDKSELKINVDISEENKNLILNTIVLQGNESELEIVTQCIDSGFNKKGLDIIYAHDMSIRQEGADLKIIVDENKVHNESSSKEI